MADINLDIAQELNVTIRRGDSLSFDVTVRDTDGDAVDLTDYTFDMDVRSSSRVSSKNNRSDIVISNTPGGKNLLLLTLSGAADGTLSVTASREATAEIAPGSYNFDISANHITNSTSQTWFYGRLVVNRDYTLR